MIKEKLINYMNILDIVLMFFGFICFLLGIFFNNILFMALSSLSFIWDINLAERIGELK
jgi:hypothetical protein